MNVKIEDTCIACGLCIEICPEVFEMGNDIAEVIDENVPENLEEFVQQAADECPVDAIIVS